VQFDFAHRIVCPDGRVVHLKGAVEQIVENGRAMLSGVVQDVTAEADAKAEAERRDYLLRLAGEVGRIGGWRADLSSGIVEWSPEAARIHESPETRQVGLRRAFGFYSPEFQGLLAARFDACAVSGVAFDEVMRVVTMRGKHIWVRTIGAPEHDKGGRIVAVQGAVQDISEQVRLHEQADFLRASQSRTLEGMSDAFLTLDKSCRFTYLNRKAETLLRRRREDLLGKVIWSEFPESNGGYFEKEFVRAVETGEMVEFEAFYEPLAIWLRATAHPSADGLAVYFRDISYDRARDQNLRLLDAAAARMNDILLITEAGPFDSPDGPRIVYVNNAFERLTGYTAAEVIGRTPRLLQGPRTQRTELDRIRTALERCEPVRAEVINYGRDGREYWLDMDITPLVDDTGRPTHFVSLQRDTTRRREAEAQLRQSEERFRLVTEATRDVVWDWNISSGATWWNDNVQRVFGHDPVKLTAIAVARQTLIHPDDAERVIAGLHAAVSGGENIWQDTYRFLRADGSAAHVRDRAVVLRDDQGIAVRMIGNMVDVTHEREIEAALRQSQKLEAIGQLTGGVAHDFNNLLTVIMGNAELLTEMLGDRDDLRAMAEMAFGAAERGAELTGRLLAFARQQALEPKVTDLNAVIGSIIPLMQRSLGENIEIKVDLADDLWLSEVDAGQFESALLNLGINGRDAMAPGGTLKITTANASIDAQGALPLDMKPGDYAVVAVTDTGTGMTPLIVERVLEPFYTTKPGGTGLGLPMAFGFARQSGGQLSILSEVGVGTTVRLYFPQSLSGLSEQPDGAVITVAPRGHGEHILVVEDNQFVRQQAVAAILGLGYRISEAENAAAALELIAAEDDIVLLFTDIVMPGGMNGRELADRALLRRPALRVLFTSGHTENTIIHQGRLDAGVQLLSKPYRRQDLALKLRSVLDQPASAM